jgi:hypothetical protein
VIGDFPNIQEFEHLAAFTKCLRQDSSCIALINEPNMLYIFFNVQLNDRQRSEVYKCMYKYVLNIQHFLQIANWFSTYVLDNYGVQWKNIFTKSYCVKLTAYQKHIYLAHFLGNKEINWVINLNKIADHKRCLENMIWDCTKFVNQV